MSLSKLEKLMYTIGVVDKATAPVNKIMGKIQQMNQMASSAQNQMMRGFMGAAGGALMLAGSLNPAIDANQSLGEVKSLAVADSALAKLNRTSLDFTSNFGGNAAMVISSAYDIQSSIAGLTGQELSDFTNASAVMAKGVKSDAGTATNYLGTMYGIYQNEAKALGKSNWVEQLAGQTATAVRMFKTNGNEMSAAFGSLGANAYSHGIEMAESMAVLGQLQATMSGSEAGTKYKAFLAGVGKAQQQLGIQLTDVHGKLLPMPQVLERLHKRFGQIDTVAKSDALSKAFGSQEATGLIKLLLPQLDQLKSNIVDLNNQTDMSTALEMANAQTDAWQRLSGSFNAAATSLGQKLMPFINPVIDGMAYILQGVLWLSEEFPILSGIVSAVTVSIVALVVGLGAYNMVMGLTKFGLIGITGATTTYNLAIGVLSKGLLFGRGALMSFMFAQQLAGGSFALFKAAMLSGIATTWAFNAALLANPITWIVGGVVLLAAVIYKYWQPIKAFMSGFWQGFKEGFAPVTAVFTELGNSLGWVGDLFGWIADKVGGLFSWFGELLSPVNQTTEQLQNATSAGVTFGKAVGAVFDFLLLPLKLFIKTLSGAFEMISSASGMIKSFFGLGDDINVEARQKIEHQIANSLPTKTVDNLQVAGYQASNVVPFSRVSENVSTSTKLPSNNKSITQVEKFEQQQIKTAEVSKPVVQKIQRSAFTQQLAQSALTSNSNSDQSKKVFIDNLTMKSDNIEQDFERLMELAG